MNKHALPFRVERREIARLGNLFPTVILHFDAVHPATRAVQERTIVVGSPLGEGHPHEYRDPLGVAILALIEMYNEVDEENGRLLELVRAMENDLPQHAGKTKVARKG